MNTDLEKSNKMTRYKLSLLIAFSLILFISIQGYPSEQRYQVTGRVVDTETGKPVPAVNVFLTNTTMGSATDKNGAFRIRYIPPGTYDLFIDHIAYERHIEHLDLFLNDVLDLEIKLKPTVLEGEIVEISARNIERRKRRLETFIDQFIGTSKNAKHCRLLNDDRIIFSEDSLTGALIAEADTVLLVENSALGYRIDIYLKSFHYEEDFINYLIYPRFYEMTSEDDGPIKKWEKNRQDIYEGSLRHFFATLAQGKYKSSRFEIYRGYIHPETAKLTTLGIPIRSRFPEFVYDEPIEELKRIAFNDFLIVQYKDFTKMTGSVRVGRLEPYPTSFLEMKVLTATINIYGHYRPHNAFKVYGVWASQRVADLLPLDFIPDE